MDEQRRRIIEDLSGTLDGEVRCDPLTISMFSSDASLYQIAPLGVAFPKHRDDVVALARYSAETHTPLVARGSGTGLAGQAIGNGLIVDFSRHMREIESIDEQSIRVQPGVVRDELNRRLKEHGRYFPPDPSNTSITTVGGMLGVDAAGSRSVRVGSTRDHVRSIETVLAGGNVVEFVSEPLEQLKMQPQAILSAASVLPMEAADNRIDNDSAKRTIISKLAKILSDNEELILEHQPALVRNCCGYFLRGIRSGSHINIPRFLVGSEGTLGLFTAATLHTAPLPQFRGIVLLLFGEIGTALDAVREISLLQPSACDLLDRRVLSLARESDPRFEKMIPTSAEAALIVEQIGFSDRQAHDRIRMVVASVQALGKRVFVGHEAYSYDEVEFLWSLPRKVVPLLTRLVGQTRPMPFVEDIAVPPDSVHEFLIRAQKVFQKHQVTASLYAHAAAGQLHLRPFLPSPSAEDGLMIENLAHDLYEIVFDVGGTISGEHGDGLSRTAFIKSQYGPLYRVFQQIKDLFDPHNLMNPGKIISDDSHLTMRNFRPVRDLSVDVVPLQLQWSHAELSASAAQCNGCGNCRTEDADLRMCPFFRLEPDEQSSPRSKANLVRNYLSGQLSVTQFISSEMKQVSDLCFNCKQCQLECPSNVNIPQMMIEAKAAHVAANGLHRTDWILSRAHSFGELGCGFSFASNWAITNPVARWWLAKLVGIHPMRKLPLFARRTFIDWARQQNLTEYPHQAGRRPVVYFVDHYVNFHDPELGKAFVAVLQHNKIPVVIPEDQTNSGMAMISAGDLDAARRIAEQNMRQLIELARERHTIVCTEPAAALCLKTEYPRLLDHPDVEMLASQVIEAGAFLKQLHERGELNTSFSPLDFEAGYHTPCHLKALDQGSPLSDLLKLIPNLRVNRIEEGCSGMAGAFGLTRENFKTSIRIGWDLISRMRSNEFRFGTTECSSCKLQMEQGTNTPTIHPVKLMALAYGLMPEIRDRLKPMTKKLVIS